MEMSLQGSIWQKKHGWLLANPAAAAVRQRYVDCDLNRCFSLSNLNGKKHRIREFKS
uniref:Aspartoacylase n=1 Tax=uncultured bacterium contig00069 TaxID=1181550 RepID=A0A806KDR2_9BACT|nr:aspartoacylase [uncultured bacterium contig00069]